MRVFNLTQEAEFDPKKHVEKILGRVEGGDVTVACWEPGQISPYHWHAGADEIFFGLGGGGGVAPAEGAGGGAAGRFRRPPAGGGARICKGAAPPAVFSCPLRPRHERPPLRLARPRRLD